MNNVKLPKTEADVRQNLYNLANFLKTVQEDNVDVEFEMGSFYSTAEGYLLNRCGASACAVGHYAVMLGWEASDDGTRPIGGFGDNPPTELHYGSLMSWTDFSDVVIGVPRDSNIEGRDAWDWMFDGDWNQSDNTAKGAAARIEYYLAHGVPEDFVIGMESSSDYEKYIRLYQSFLDQYEQEQNPPLLVESISINPKVAK